MHGTLMTLTEPTVYARSSLVRKQAIAFMHDYTARYWYALCNHSLVCTNI